MPPPNRAVRRLLMGDVMTHESLNPTPCTPASPAPQRPPGFIRRQATDSPTRDDAPVAEPSTPANPPLAGRGKRSPRTLTPPAEPAPVLLPEQRLLLLDTWIRSGLPAADFADLVGISKHSLYAWQ